MVQVSDKAVKEGEKLDAFLGIDIGSVTCKFVLMDIEGNVLTSVFLRNRGSPIDSAKAGMEDLRKKIEESDELQEYAIRCCGTTGSARYLTKAIVGGDLAKTEIIAHAVATQSLYPDVRTILEIGGQDSKAILISKKTGNVMDFQMNDKCAAGTGRFLEVMAHALEVPIEEIGELALNSNKPSAISSTCTVFAESEVISLIARGTAKHDIAAGIHKSIARRVAGMAKRIGVAPLLVFCGGVAKNIAVKKFLEEELGYEIVIPDHPQLTGAIGAALIAQEHNGG